MLKHEAKPLEQLNLQEATLGYNGAGGVLDAEASEMIFRWLEAQT
ncbi:MAG: hypothetical protein NWE93_14830 [Candidatus Bathyarchaeota archaeon]|nr:hypothetical protein [Candidatus Bathyarchaeota archaeon]